MALRTIRPRWPVLLSITGLLAFAATAVAEPDPSSRLMTGRAWADYCDRIKAMGERLLREDFPAGERRWAMRSKTKTSLRRAGR